MILNSQSKLKEKQKGEFIKILNFNAYYKVKITKIASLIKTNILATVMDQKHTCYT